MHTTIHGQVTKTLVASVFSAQQLTLLLFALRRSASAGSVVALDHAIAVGFDVMIAAFIDGGLGLTAASIPNSGGGGSGGSGRHQMAPFCLRLEQDPAISTDIVLTFLMIVVRSCGT